MMIMMFVRHLIVGLLVLSFRALAQGAPSARGAKDDEKDMLVAQQAPPHHIAFVHNHRHHAHHDIATMDEDHIEAHGHQGHHAHHGHVDHHGPHAHHGHPGHHGHHGLHTHHAGNHVGVYGHPTHGHGHHEARGGHHHQFYRDITARTHHHHVPMHDGHDDRAPEHRRGHGRHHHGRHGHRQPDKPSSEWYWFKISNRLPRDTVLNVRCRDDRGLNERHKDVLHHKFVVRFKMQEQEYWTCLMKFEGTEACKEVKVWENPMHAKLDCEFCTWKVTADGMYVKEGSEENGEDVWVLKYGWEDCDSGLPWDGE